VSSPKESLDKTPTGRNRLKLVAAVLTFLGLCLFAYFVYAVGFWEIVDGIAKFGVAGFGVILAIYFIRICMRAFAWRLSVHPPFILGIKDTIPAVVIGEALSSTIPLGILISGTSKAVAVRRRIPLVAGLSSVATENLFYSFITGLFLIAGAFVLLFGFSVDPSLSTLLYAMVATLTVATVLGIAMVVREWHFASWLCNRAYENGILTHLLENGRREVRRFEDLIYGFYRVYPRRFVPICLLEAAFHALGVVEAWFVIWSLGETVPRLQTAFLLESVSRLVIILFKLIPFNIGVDEAGAELMGSAIALGVGVGVTMAIIRKGRILFWAAVGMLLIAKRGLRLGELSVPASQVSNK